MDILSLLNWRYAAKRMTGQEVPQEKIDRILESIQLSASSIGMQPFRVLVIKDTELKSKIREVAANQPQITEASHLLVFAAWDTITQERVEDYLNRTIEVRQVTRESLAPLKAYADSMLNNSPEQNFNWTSRQAYIALGTALIAAAAEKVDATPMEGFNPQALDELLGLQELGLKSVTLLPLGYRDIENDWLVNLPKVRTKKEDLFITDKELQATASA
ncbi:NAD(P)H-dependent oxidoreductase [Pedobacter sp. SYSU D00535]|uniref:NAD(P)H-dependent oxidoreductase n=1 Tax=Pedobacter sp. SYSU D00535 TaxID=2810308 RepID=UPI001A96FF10|nr:NAD(P)H-dependent oxidoreductase [Pedobacter sp. SYSU D00535]